MAEPLTQIAIEVPRVTQRVAGTFQSSSDWTIGEVNILERAVKAALEFCDPNEVRLLTGAPDEGIFRLVEEYGVVETELPGWLQRTADAARSAEEQDVVAFMRAGVVLRDYAPLGKAIDAVRHIGDVERCEAAFKPQSFDSSLGNIHCVERREDGVSLQPWQDKIGQSLEDFAILCPAFEVMKLRSFTVNRIGGLAQTGTAFVWVDEGDQVSLDSPLDWLRAEIMLKND